MSAQVKQQVIRFVRLSVFGALAVSPAGQAVARDLHQLAADGHALFVTPGAVSVVLVALAENVTRSIVPTAPAGGKSAAKTGTAARLLVWASGALSSMAQKLVGAPTPPTA